MKGWDRRCSDTKPCGWGVLMIQVLAVAMTEAAPFVRPDPDPHLLQHTALKMLRDKALGVEELSGTMATLPALKKNVCLK